MRVGLVCPYSLTLPGGVQGQVLGLGRALRQLGVDARILGPCDGPPPDPAVTPLGNSVPTASNGSMAAIAPDPSAALRTIRALRDENFDVVNIHEPLCPGPSLTALLFNDGPIVGTFHRSGESGWYNALKPLVVWRAKRLTVRVAVSTEARDTAAAATGGDYEVLWNGIDVSVYQREDAWPTKEPTVMFVGRHEPRKGLAVLIEAIRRLGPDVKLWIASEGPETARLRGETAGDDRFEWLGTIDEEEKIARMRGAGVLCAPSLHGESFGVILLEGMASATPVVATDLVGYRHVARPGVDALLVPPGDPARLAEALRTALDGGPEVEAMVECGLERARSFSMSGLAERYAELFEGAVRNRPPGRWRVAR
ncbi:MAG TPA: glycosyltransferase family 4 protein [Acidimicrobiales bacterium]|nr:glycosyltransferase family 4 protein [Acidimicrobiales bacterium]